VWRIPAFGDGLEAIEEIFLAVNMGSTNLEASAYRRGEQISPATIGAQRIAARLA
jgi:hypothetical protein